MIDPAAIRAENRYPDRSLEQQLEDVTDSVKHQQIRASQGEFRSKETNELIKFDERVLHVINLFRIRPIDRDFVMAAFKAKAMKKGINIDHVIFLNQSPNKIYEPPVSE